MSGGIGSADMDMDMDMDMSTGSVVVSGGMRVRPIGVSPALTTVPDANGVMEVYCHQAYSETGCIESQLNADILGFVAEATTALDTLGDQFIFIGA